MIPVDDIIAEAMRNNPGASGEVLEQSIKDLLKYRFEQHERQKKIMDFLEIPFTDGHAIKEDTVKVSYLIDIFMDEKKRQELITKLRNKAFW
jgi:hypothetical protein